MASVDEFMKTLFRVSSPIDGGGAARAFQRTNSGVELWSGPHVSVAQLF